MGVDYSLITCTYNPDERLLKRCLHAISNLAIEGIGIEVILVDNNSVVPVKELACVKEYAKRINNFNSIHVSQQGVSYARIAAINKATGKHIVYFDYDNEPDKYYLQVLKKLNKTFPKVAAWGPGNVYVDFIDGIDNEIEDYGRKAFQGKREDKILFAGTKEWEPFYPFGTGLCMDTFLLKEYVDLAAMGKYTMTGRKANELSGGEDTQMVLHCVSKRYEAGISPDLKLTHIIPSNRANFDYLKRFAYYTGLDYMTCLLEVFPEHQTKITNLKIAESKFVRQTVKKYIKLKFANSRLELFNLINYISFNEGVYRALKMPVPRIVSTVIKRLRIK